MKTSLAKRKKFNRELSLIVEYMNSEMAEGQIELKDRTLTWRVNDYEITLEGKGPMWYFTSPKNKVEKLLDNASEELPGEVASLREILNNYNK